MAADDGEDPAELHRRGAELVKRFETGGHPPDLELAVTLHRRAVALTGPDDEDRAERLDGLGSALLTRFEQSEDPADLAAALDLLRTAVEAAVAGSAAEVEALSAFGSALQAQYEYSGDLAVLQEAVAVGRRAADAMASGHPRLSTVLLDLGSALHLLFLRSSDVRDMDESIRVTTTVVEARPRPGAGRAAALSNLSAAYRVRYDRLGQRADVETGLAAAREAVAAAPAGDPYRCGYLYNLSVALRTRYDAYGAAADLDEAVIVAQQAAAAAPGGYPALPMFLSNVAGLLIARYRRRPATADLEAAVRAAGDAVRAAPEGHLHRAGYLSNLAVMLRSRYGRLGRIEDLDESIRAGREAVDLTSPGDPARLRRLANLSIALRLRHTVSGAPADLDETVSAITASVDGTPGDDPARLGRLAGLAATYEARYALTGRPEDRESALAAARRAADGTAADHSARARRLIAVANLADDTSALPLLREAAGVDAASTISRLDAAHRWARCAARIGDRQASLEGYEATVALLEQAVWPGLPFPDRIFSLEQVAGIAGEAAAAAVDNGLPGRALLLLERARGLLYAHRLATDADRSVIGAAAPELAGEMLAVRRELDETDRLGDAADEVDAVVTGRGSWDRRRRLMDRWEQLVTRARTLPGLEDFLRPPSLESLITAAGDGPVIVVNVGRSRCDALIVTTAGVDLLPLPQLTLTAARRVSAGYLRAARNPLRPGADRNLRAVLAWLWETVTGPVLDHLGMAHRDGPPWPRLWWCPAGPLAVLPLHASGHWDAGALADVGVLDRVVSSYTPTVGALAHARSRSRAPGDDALLAVRAGGDLPYTGQEVARIAGRLPPGRVTVLHGAGRAAVSAGMGTHGWLHYAGHSRADLGDPGASGLELADGRLTFQEIAALRLPAARFAYLSSCETGAGSARLPDEVLHLCGAAQLAGYQRVVGTYWPVADRAAAMVAAELYERMDTGGDLDPGLAADALHAVARRLRAAHRVTTWAAYFHAGP